MATEIGTSTSYPITIPSGTDNADIQSALRLISYGIPGTPTSNAQITDNSIFGKMSLLAPKTSPAFTGNGSITGNFSVGGNLTVTGTLNTLVGSSSIFEDKNLILNGNPSTPSTDLLADGGGISINGLTVKNFTFSNGIGWNSSENINLVTGKTFKINGTDVLSSTTVLGILGTNIAKKDSANAFTGPNTFSGATQTINGVTIATNGYISKSLVNNEWDGVTIYAPGQNITYQVTSSSHLAYNLISYFDDPGNTGYGWFNWGESIRLSMTPGSLMAGDVLAVSLSQYSYWVGSFNAVINAIGTNYIDVTSYTAIYQTYSNGAVPPSNSYAGYGGTVIDNQYDGINGQRPSVQYWNVGGTDVANIDRFGNFTATGNSIAASFKDAGKTYHTNAGVPYFDLNVTSGNLFSATTAPVSPTGWANTTAGSSTGATSAKWYALGPASPIVSSNNISYATESGYGLATISQSGKYRVSASMTVSSTAVTGTMFGIYVVSVDGTKNIPVHVSNIGVSNITGTISAVIDLTAGQKIGLAVKTASAVAVALKNTDGSFRFSANLIG